jgi:hypothetical protein
MLAQTVHISAEKEMNYKQTYAECPDRHMQYVQIRHLQHAQTDICSMPK